MVSAPGRAAGRIEEAAPWLPALADALAEALPRLLQERSEPRLAEVIRALTAALARGETELPLAGEAPPEVDPRHWPEGHRTALAASALAAAPDGPLVLDDDRLLWRRWWERRQEVLANLIQRAHAIPENGQGDAAAESLPEPSEGPALDPDQRRAVEAVRRHHLVLLQGGPGTGKTSTVARMLADRERWDPQARVHLAAPTGKAAARLRMATGGRHPCTTLHRLLESRGNGFARNRQHPLCLDLLVVDEVSMVDLALMEALLDALPERCRLVLVGDPAQLPPVAPGALLPELQRPALRDALGEAAITLRTVHRNDGAIAEVAGLLRQQIEAEAHGSGQGSGEATDPLLALRERLRQLTPADNLTWHESAMASLPELLLEPLRQQQRRLAELARACPPGAGADRNAELPLLAERERLLVLGPRRRGRWGVEAIHRALLGERVLSDPRLWPVGTPALCTRNLPELGLANGDVGLVLDADPEDGTRWLLFADGEAGSGSGAGSGPATRRLHPAQLAGSLEPALALTVHKAQGSEAESVIVLLPGGDHQDSRLLYTALTRARRRALLIQATVDPEPSGEIEARRGAAKGSQGRPS
jgi:exodeoxyribonuclease V alpha subunit